MLCHQAYRKIADETRFDCYGQTGKAIRGLIANGLTSVLTNCEIVLLGHGNRPGHVILEKDLTANFFERNIYVDSYSRHFEDRKIEDDKEYYVYENEYGMTISYEVVARINVMDYVKKYMLA
jgi:hypothetical protein